MKRSLSTVLLLSLVGCASAIKLNPGAEKVKIVKHILKKDLKKLEEVAFVECEQGMNGRTRATNVEACENKLRNEAFSKGGSIVLLKEKKQVRGGTGLLMATGSSYCENCIEMSGVVYKRK